MYKLFVRRDENRNIVRGWSTGENPERVPTKYDELFAENVPWALFRLSDGSVDDPKLVDPLFGPLYRGEYNNITSVLTGKKVDTFFQRRTDSQPGEVYPYQRISALEQAVLEMGEHIYG